MRRPGRTQHWGVGPGWAVAAGLWLLVLFLGKPAAAADGAVPLRGPLAYATNPSAHDPSTIVRWRDKFWVFVTGRGVATRWSTNLIHWQEGPRVFAESPAWARAAVPNHRGNLWAPDVIFHNGRFHLYYSVSTWGRNTSAIGLVTNPTLDPDDSAFRWNDEGRVVQSSTGDNFNAIDPGVTRDAHGNLWLVFGSYWSGIQLVQLDPQTGRRLAGAPFHALAHHSSIEAAAIHRHGDWYYLFVNWGQCCRGVQSTYEIRMGRSANITGPYQDREGRDLLTGGGTLFAATAGRFIGPGHAGFFTHGGTDWFSFHFYDGQRAGAKTLEVAPLVWGADGWPRLQHECAAPRP